MNRAQVDTVMGRLYFYGFFDVSPRTGAGIGVNLVSHAEDHEGTRRDFLYFATAGAGAVTAGAAIWPLVNQMNASM